MEEQLRHFIKKQRANIAIIRSHKGFKFQNKLNRQLREENANAQEFILNRLSQEFKIKED